MKIIIVNEKSQFMVPDVELPLTQALMSLIAITDFFFDTYIFYIEHSLVKGELIRKFIKKLTVADAQ